MFISRIYWFLYRYSSFIIRYWNDCICTIIILSFVKVFFSCLIFPFNAKAFLFNLHFHCYVLYHPFLSIGMNYICVCVCVCMRARARACVCVKKKKKIASYYVWEAFYNLIKQNESTNELTSNRIFSRSHEWFIRYISFILSYLKRCKIFFFPLGTYNTIRDIHRPDFTLNYHVGLIKASLSFFNIFSFDR